MKRLRLVVLTAILSASTPLMMPAQEVSFGVDPLEVMGPARGTPLAGAALDAHTEELTDRMRCPVCQGLSIADSGTAIAMAMKAEVKQFLAAGYTDDQILGYFESSYGEFIRLEPKATGFNLFVWIAPFAALVLGLALVIRRLRPQRVTTALGPPPPDDEEGLDEYRARVRSELGT